MNPNVTKGRFAKTNDASMPVSLGETALMDSAARMAFVYKTTAVPAVAQVPAVVPVRVVLRAGLAQPAAVVVEAVVSTHRWWNQ